MPTSYLLIGSGIVAWLVSSYVSPSGSGGGGNAAAPRNVLRWRPKVDTLTRKYGGSVSSDLVMAIVWQESGGNPDAEGSAGELGLMQVTPIASQDIGEPPLVYNSGPEEQLKHGIKYLKKCNSEYTNVGNRFTTLRCYNEGPPPFTKEASKRYAQQVLDKLSRINGN